MAVFAVCAASCGSPPVDVAGGDPGRGVVAIQEKGCDMCHTIPGVAELAGTVKGPSLARWARRDQIAGRIPNQPDSLIRWLRDPHALDPETAMSPLGIEEQQARDIAAFLYTLR